MKLFLFKLKLLVYLGFFLVRLVANISDKTKPALFTIFLFLLFGVLFTIISNKTPSEQELIEISPTRLPQNLGEFNLQSMTEEEIQQELNIWLDVSQVQPKSRDVLLNISQLYSALNDTQRADLYLEKAKLIAPNHDLLQ